MFLLCELVSERDRSKLLVNFQKISERESVKVLLSNEEESEATFICYQQRMKSNIVQNT